MGKANVMLSYPIDEAEVLLDTKLKAAKLSLSNCEEDMDFLREQITVIHLRGPVYPFHASLTKYRLWRWLLPGYTTGMLCTNARRRRKRRSKKGKTRIQEPESRGTRCTPSRVASKTQLMAMHSFIPCIL
jgi:hypothetical protein